MQNYARLAKHHAKTTKGTKEKRRLMTLGSVTIPKNQVKIGENTP
jgi:hypothetical protein